MDRGSISAASTSKPHRNKDCSSCVWTGMVWNGHRLWGILWGFSKSQPLSRPDATIAACDTKPKPNGPRHKRPNASAWRASRAPRSEIRADMPAGRVGAITCCSRQSGSGTWHVDSGQLRPKIRRHNAGALALLAIRVAPSARAPFELEVAPVDEAADAARRADDARFLVRTGLVQRPAISTACRAHAFRRDPKRRLAIQTVSFLATHAHIVARWVSDPAALER